ncbi:MAG: MerR family transcriptional regulator [Ruminococcus sp.]|nr:MerR family transcriptional regulator [Ruminococcus sp.]
MKTVNEVSKLTGVSIRTLQYYDSLGLLAPAARTEAGYRLYDDTALERLRQIMLFRELDFPLSEIKAILDSPHFDRNDALTRQIELLRLKKERLERIIALAEDMKQKGDTDMDFEAFDSKVIEEYAQRAKEKWGGTPQYEEYEQKHGGETAEEQKSAADEFMELFAQFGALKDKPADSPEAQEMTAKLKAFITEHYYTCTDEILYSLGQMYAAEGEFRTNIDRAGGEGTAGFVSRAIAVYCGK